MELSKEYFDQQLGNLSTKGDLDRLANKEDLEQIRDDFRIMKSEITEITETLTNLDKRDREDSNAFAKTLVKQDERLDAVEQDIKKLKLKPV
jgi:hypothetical protein